VSDRSGASKTKASEILHSKVARPGTHVFLLFNTVTPNKIIIANANCNLRPCAFHVTKS
jgi:hypothetical protein